MPRKGYQSVTLKDEVVEVIDSLVDSEKKERKTRQRVIEEAVKKLRGDEDYVELEV